MNFTPIVVSDTNGTVYVGVNDPKGMAPKMVLAGLADVAGGIAGVPTPEGIVPGVGFISGSNPNAPFFIVFANTGTGVAPDSRSTLVRVYGYQAEHQGCNPGFEILTAHGSFNAPQAVKAGDRLGKYCGMGHSGTGYYPNESGSFSIWADQDFAPVGPVIRSGGACAISTAQENTNVETFRAYWDSRGNFYVGDKHPYANNFPCKGTIILQECKQPPIGNADGAVVFFVQNGALKVCGASGSVTTLAPA